MLKDFDSPDKIKGWRDSFKKPEKGNFYLVAEINGKAVGNCLGEEQEDINEICAIYISPDYHRQGIGTALMEAALAKLNPKKKTKLNVVSYNDKAINFYKKFGFEENGPVDDIHGHLPSGKVMPEIEMIKDRQSTTSGLAPS